MQLINERDDLTPGSDAVFSWRAREVGSILHIWFTGELDLRTEPTTRAALRDPLAAGRRTVVVDMSDVSFMDSTGLRLVIGMKKDVEARRGRFVIARPSPQVERVLGLAGLDAWFERLDEED